MKEIFRSILRSALALVMLLSVGFGALLSVASPAQAATAPSLGTAGNYAVLAGTTVTNTGATVITGGDVGVAPGSSITNFPPGIVVPPNIIHVGNDAATILAQTNLVTAYNSAAGQPFNTDLSGSDLGSLAPLVPGVYKFTSSAQLTGTLTLNGGPTDVWIFQIGSTLTTASNSRVVFTGGGSSCNVFWQVGSSATLGSGSAIVGNVMALTTITMNTGATIAGRALARNGAVNLDTAGITVCSLCTTITLAPATLPGGQLTVAYSQTITASGGTGPYTYAITSGAQPTGLNLSAGGLLSGTPTATGTFTFTVKATDTGVIPNCFGSLIYTVVISPFGCPTILLAPTPPLPSGTVGMAYSTQTITALGGTGPYTYAVSTGSLPTGLVLSTGGVLSGVARAGGSFTFTITATDHGGSPLNCLGAQIYSIIINGSTPCPPITVSPASLPPVPQGSDYSVAFTAAGGTAPYLFSLASGNLPQGLQLSSSGLLSGTAASPGSFTFGVTATDANGCLGATFVNSLNIIAATVSRRGSGGVPGQSTSGANGANAPTQLSDYVINTVCVSPEGNSDKVTLCLKNTGSTPQKVVATLTGNNATIGQKTFDLGPNAVVCDSWLVSGAQKATTYRVNVGGSYEQNVPLCNSAAAGQASSSDVWIYLLIALAVIIIIVILYFVMRKR
jgi:hypothetical protein